VILSDGDVVFQPRKIECSGLFDAVGGRVLIYIHKEQELDDVERRFPAERYVLVDDKVRILAAVKKAWGVRLTHGISRQGHYAHAPDVAKYPPADITIERIGELLPLTTDPRSEEGIMKATANGCTTLARASGLDNITRGSSRTARSRATSASSRSPG